MRYTKYSPAPPKKNVGLHPVWRGIGCTFFVLIPVISYFLADVAVEAGWINRIFPLPRSMTGTVFVPGVGPFEHLYGNLVIAVAFMAVLFGAMTIVYSAVYRWIGPPKYGPLDSPPIRGKRKPRRSR